eukprot:SAG31_NODE_2240_length_6111_cov_11.710246_4_plen_113_part_00
MTNRCDQHCRFATGGIPTSFTFDLSTGKHGGAGKSRLQAKKKQRKAKGENLESAVGGPHKLVIKPVTHSYLSMQPSAWSNVADALAYEISEKLSIARALIVLTSENDWERKR